MALTRVEAVILKTHAYSDTSLIVRLYSREMGKLSVIAKGARRPKSPFSGVLDHLNHVSMIFYYKEGRDLYTAKECDLIDPFGGLRERLDRTAVALAIAELLHWTSLEGASQPALFEALLRLYRALSGAERHVRNFYWTFALRLLEESGTRFEWGSCTVCGGGLVPERITWSLERGGMLCPGCAGTVPSDGALGAESWRVGMHLAGCPPDRLANLTMSHHAAQELQELLTRYMRCHLPGFRESVSLRLLTD